MPRTTALTNHSTACARTGVHGERSPARKSASKRPFLTPYEPSPWRVVTADGPLGASLMGYDSTIDGCVRTMSVLDHSTDPAVRFSTLIDGASGFCIILEDAFRKSSP